MKSKFHISDYWCSASLNVPIVLAQTSPRSHSTFATLPFICLRTGSLLHSPNWTYYSTYLSPSTQPSSIQVWSLLPTSACSRHWGHRQWEGTCLSHCWCCKGVSSQCRPVWYRIKGTRIINCAYTLVHGLSDSIAFLFNRQNTYSNMYGNIFTCHVLTLRLKFNSN